MGMTFDINTIEEMCDLMCDNKIPEKEGYWIFTFGCGQKHAGYYVKIFGTWQTARQKMLDKYGRDWGFQYSEEEWDDWKLNCPPYVPLEKELEIIP